MTVGHQYASPNQKRHQPPSRASSATGKPRVRRSRSLISVCSLAETLVRARIPSYTSLTGEATVRRREAWGGHPIPFSTLPSSDVAPFAGETISVLA
jgi:hypothetical protein